MISVVVPVYGCKGALLELHRRLVESLRKIGEDYEIVLVNDACPQNSWEVIKEICDKDSKVVGINLSRNFGQIRAITAGLEQCKGDWVVVMDCDLQDRPEEIENLYNRAKEGYDVVFARRVNRQDGGIKKFFSKMFYKTYEYFTEGGYDNTISNFSISSRSVVDSYLSMREQNRAFTIFIKWIGFNQTSIDVQHDKRAEGKSSYNFKKRFKMASEIITAQSNKPLVMSIRFGFVISFMAFVYAIFLIIRYFAKGITVQGWTSTMVSIYFVGGIILMNLGIIGLYIGYIFNETKNRPIYIIKDILNKK